MTTVVIKKEVRRVFVSSSDDSAIMQQVLATHAPDGRQVDLDLLISIIEEALHHAVPPEIECIINQGEDPNFINADTEEEEVSGFDFLQSIPDGLAQVIHQISCEFECKCSGGTDAHSSAIAILNILSNYTWEAKAVIALGAFAAKFGEFWLVAQLYATNQLAKAIALLKHMPDVMEHYKLLKPRFDSINVLIKSMLDVTKCIVAVKNLPCQYIQDDEEPKSTATTQVPNATYWSIKSMVACTAQISGLLGMNYEYITSTSESWELSTLAQNVENIHQQLKTLLSHCYQYIETKQQDEYHLMLVRFKDEVQSDNLKILKALFCAKDSVHPLLHGYSKTRVNVDILRSKTVLLLISDLDISLEEITTLNQIYIDSQANQDLQYEIVWVPIVDHTTWTESHQHKFEQLQLMMTWHTVHHPMLLDTGVVKYIKQEWHFEKKPMLVSLDQNGKVQSENALHMVWIWGNSAYPFSTTKEESLWNEESWKLDFLVGNAHENIKSWVSEEKYVCLYGGDDIDWIREYTKQVTEIATNAGINLELVYVGKSDNKEKVKKICKIINEEKLSHTLADQTAVWYFWTRLQSMLYSKIQQKKSLENDFIMKEVITMMSLNGNDQGWTLISKGSTEMVKANADMALETLTQYHQWEGGVSEYGFLAAFKGSIEKLHTLHHCNRLILPETSGVLPEVVVCSDCGRPMEKFIMFRCCTD